MLIFGTVVVGGCSRTGLLDDDYARAPLACVKGTVQLSQAFPTVMFVLDRSTSMTAYLGDTHSRWDALRSALGAKLAILDRSVRIGALLFPSIPIGQSCEVNVSPNLLPKLGNVSDLVALMDRTSLGGATPTAAAIESAANVLLGVRASSTARALVLATDGGPDCNVGLNARTCRCAFVSGPCHDAVRCLDDERTVQYIAKYEALGIPTYVIGIHAVGDTEYSDVLNAMADAGGSVQTNAEQRYYAARSEAELDAALTAISERVGRCVYLTSSVPDAGGTIELRWDGTLLTEDQWAWQQRSNGELVLRPDICQQVLSEESPLLEAHITCTNS